MLMGLQAKKHHPQEVPIRSSTHRANLWAAPGVPPFSPVLIGQVPEDRLTHRAGVTGRPSHRQRAASVTASGTGARGGRDKNQIAPFLAPGMLCASGSTTRNGCSPMFIVSLSQS